MNGISWTLAFITILLVVTIIRLTKRVEYYRDKAQRNFELYSEECIQNEALEYKILEILS